MKKRNTQTERISGRFGSALALAALLLAVFASSLQAQNPYPPYDFKAANADGDTLYYRITSSTAPYTVAVTRCHDSATYALQLPLSDYDTLVVVPETVSFGEVIYSVIAVDERAFSLQQGIRTVQLPASVLNIGASAFAHSSLLNFIIPATTTFVGDSTFAYTLVESMEIPGNIPVLKTGTFVGCYSLSSLILNEGLQEIEENIFSSNCIQTLVFPASLRKFRPLTSGNLPCKRIVFQSDSLHPDDTLFLAPSCFRGLSQHLQQVDFSDNIFQLPNSCFAGFRGLVGTVTLPSRLTVVPYRCFYDCELFDVQFPSTLDTIADQVFMNSFVNHPVFTIPAGIKHIGSRAFHKGDMAFITMEGEQPPTLGEKAFNTNRTLEITVPCGSLPQYLAAPDWSSLPTHQTVTIEEDCVGVEDYDLEFKVYPNPVEDIVFIELRSDAEIANVALYDLQGRIVTGVFDTPQRGGTATINVKSIPAGVYVLRVTDADGKEYHQKIVRK